MHIKHNPTKKFPIILHNHYGLSNGFVAWLPRRSEFYTLSPSQDHSLVGNNSWLNTLAIHEYRHVAQQEFALSKLLFKLAALFNGELWPATLTSIHFPDWYFEGDAIMAETTLSNYGRGREANLTRLARMQSIEYPHLVTTTTGTSKYAK